MITVQLDKKKHNRNRFDCEVEALNSYLKIMANQQANRDNTRTFVLEDEKNSKYIIGYYTLTMIPIILDALPAILQKKHQNAQTAGLIARLAVDKRYIKRGFGEWLLVDVLKKMLLVSDTVGFPLIVVDAKDGSIAFYKKFGFQPFQDNANKLFMTIADVRENLQG